MNFPFQFNYLHDFNTITPIRGENKNYFWLFCFPFSKHSILYHHEVKHLTQYSNIAQYYILCNNGYNIIGTLPIHLYYITLNLLLEN
jgi:hypothetical protein